MKETRLRQKSTKCGNLVITFNAGAYSYYHHILDNLYEESQGQNAAALPDIERTTGTDTTGVKICATYKIKGSQREGCVINCYHTTCTCRALVNGKVTLYRREINPLIVRRMDVNEISQRNLDILSGITNNPQGGPATQQMQSTTKRRHSMSHRQPTSRQGQPENQHGQPTSQQGQPTIHQGQPTSQQGQPTSQQGQPTSQQGHHREPARQQGQPTSHEHTSHQGQPTSQQGQPTSQQRQPTSQQGQPTSHRREPTSQQGQPKIQQRQPTSRQGQSTSQLTSQQGQPTRQQGQPTNHEHESQQGHTMSHPREPTSQQRQPEIQQRQPTSRHWQTPSHEHTSHQGQPARQQGQPTSQQEQPTSQQGQPPSQQGQPTNQGQPISQQGQPTIQQGQPASQQGQPASQQGQPTSQQGQPTSQPTSHQGQPTTHQGQPTSQQGQPTSQQGQPASQQGQPVSQHGQPTSQQGQPTSQQGQPASQQGQPASQQRQPTSRQGQPTSHEHTSHQGQHTSHQGQHTSHQGQLTSQQGQPTSQHGQPTSHQGQPASQQGRPTRQQGQPTSHQGRPTSHQGRPTSQQGQSTSHQGQPTSHVHTSHQGQHTSHQGQHTSHQGQPTSQQGHPTSQQGQPTSQQGQPKKQQGRPTSQQGQPKSHQGWLTSQLGQPTSQQGQSTSHQEQSTSHQGQLINFDEETCLKQKAPTKGKVKQPKRLTKRKTARLGQQTETQHFVRPNVRQKNGTCRPGKDLEETTLKQLLPTHCTSTTLQEEMMSMETLRKSPTHERRESRSERGNLGNSRDCLALPQTVNHSSDADPIHDLQRQETCPICNQPMQDETIECDQCEKFVHFYCENIDDRILAEANRTKEYICSSCFLKNAEDDEGRTKIKMTAPKADANGKQNITTTKQSDDNDVSRHQSRKEQGACRDILATPNATGNKRTSEANMTIDLAEGEAYPVCPICDQPARHRAIECSICEQWIHYACENIEDTEVISSREYICSPCYIRKQEEEEEPINIAQSNSSSHQQNTITTPKEVETNSTIETDNRQNPQSKKKGSKNNNNKKKTQGQPKHDCTEVERKLTLLQAETARLEDIINEQKNTIRIYKIRLAVPRDHQIEQKEASLIQLDSNRDVHDRLTALELDNLKLRMTHLETEHKLYGRRESSIYNLCPQCKGNNNNVIVTCHQPTVNQVMQDSWEKTTATIERPTHQSQPAIHQRGNTSKDNTYHNDDEPLQGQLSIERDKCPRGPSGVSRESLATPQQLVQGGYIVPSIPEVIHPAQTNTSYIQKSGSPTQQPQRRSSHEPPTAAREVYELSDINQERLATSLHPSKGAPCATNMRTDGKHQEWKKTGREGNHPGLYGVSRESLATPLQLTQEGDQAQGREGTEESTTRQPSHIGNDDIHMTEHRYIGSDHIQLGFNDNLRDPQKKETDRTKTECHNSSQECLVTSQQTTPKDHHPPNHPEYTHADTNKGPVVTQQHPMTNQTHFLSKGRANTETSHQSPTSPNLNQQLPNRFRTNPWMMHRSLTACQPIERSTIPLMGTHPIQNMTQQTQRDICIPTWKYYESPPLFKHPVQLWHHQMAQAGIAWRSQQQVPLARTRL